MELTVLGFRSDQGIYGADAVGQLLAAGGDQLGVADDDEAGEGQIFFDGDVRELTADAADFDLIMFHSDNSFGCDEGIKDQ